MPDVTIYTKPGCPFCAAARDNLRSRGIDYKEIDVQSDPKALAEMLKISEGRRSVPVVVEDGTVTVGFGGS